MNNTYLGKVDSYDNKRVNITATNVPAYMLEEYKSSLPQNTVIFSSPQYTNDDGVTMDTSYHSLLVTDSLGYVANFTQVNSFAQPFNVKESKSVNDANAGKLELNLNYNNTYLKVNPETGELGVDFEAIINGLLDRLPLSKITNKNDIKESGKLYWVDEDAELTEDSELEKDNFYTYNNSNSKTNLLGDLSDIISRIETLEGFHGAKFVLNGQALGCDGLIINDTEWEHNSTIPAGTTICTFTFDTSKWGGVDVKLSNNVGVDVGYNAVDETKYTCTTKEKFTAKGVVYVTITATSKSGLNNAHITVSKIGDNNDAINAVTISDNNNTEYPLTTQISTAAKLCTITVTNDLYDFELEGTVTDVANNSTILSTLTKDNFKTEVKASGNVNTTVYDVYFKGNYTVNGNINIKVKCITKHIVNVTYGLYNIGNADLFKYATYYDDYSSHDNLLASMVFNAENNKFDINKPPYAWPIDWMTKTINISFGDEHLTQAYGVDCDNPVSMDNVQVREDIREYDQSTKSIKSYTVGEWKTATDYMKLSDRDYEFLKFDNGEYRRYGNYSTDTQNYIQFKIALTHDARRKNPWEIKVFNFRVPKRQIGNTVLDSMDNTVLRLCPSKDNYTINSSTNSDNYIVSNLYQDVNIIKTYDKSISFNLKNYVVESLLKSNIGLFKLQPNFYKYNTNLANNFKEGEDIIENCCVKIAPIIKSIKGNNNVNYMSYYNSTTGMFTIDSSIDAASIIVNFDVYENHQYTNYTDGGFNAKFNITQPNIYKLNINNTNSDIPINVNYDGKNETVDIGENKDISVTQGSSVTLTQGTSTAHFRNWGGDFSTNTSDTLTIQMGADKSVAPTSYYTLTVNKPNIQTKKITGTTSKGQTIDSDASTTVYNIAKNETVTLLLTEVQISNTYDTSMFADWGGDYTNEYTDTLTNITLSKDSVVSPKYDYDKFVVDLTGMPSDDNVVVTTNGDWEIATFNNPGKYTLYIGNGSIITVSGGTVTAWSKDDNGTTQEIDSYSFTQTASNSKKTYTLTPIYKTLIGIADINVTYNDNVTVSDDMLTIAVSSDIYPEISNVYNDALGSVIKSITIPKLDAINKSYNVQAMFISIDASNPTSTNTGYYNLYTTATGFEEYMDCDDDEAKYAVWGYGDNILGYTSGETPQNGIYSNDLELIFKVLKSAGTEFDAASYVNVYTNEIENYVLPVQIKSV